MKKYLKKNTSQNKTILEVWTNTNSFSLKVSTFFLKKKKLFKMN